MKNILAAWPEKPSGPGWSNRIIWVLVRDDGELKMECIQPEQQTPEMAILFETAYAAANALRAAVELGIEPETSDD